MGDEDEPSSDEEDTPVRGAGRIGRVDPPAARLGEGASALDVPIPATLMEATETGTPAGRTAREGWRAAWAANFALPGAGASLSAASTHGLMEETGNLERAVRDFAQARGRPVGAVPAAPSHVVGGVTLTPTAATTINAAVVRALEAADGAMREV